MPRKPMSEETKQKIREAMKLQWQNKEQKQKRSNAMKRKWQDKEYRQKVSDAIIEKWQNEDYRDRNSTAIKCGKNKPENIEKFSQSIKKAYENPEFHQKLSTSLKLAYSNPELRQKLSEAVKKAMSSKKFKQKRSKISKKMWQNEDHRQKVSLKMKSIWNNEDFRTLQKEKFKQSQQKLSEQHKQEFIEKYSLSKELLEEKFVKNNRFNILKFCEYCNISYHTGLYYKRYFSIEVPNIQYQCKIQQEIFDFISQYVQATFNDRQIISPKELDIFIPERNIAIEFDGLFYHSTGYSDIPGCNGIEEFPAYHLEKTQVCNEKGIKLFHIFEDEWRDKKEIWKSVLLNALGKSNRVYARKCIIKFVSSKETKEFLNHNHLQGSCNSSINIGLYSDDTLISLMTFGKSRYNKQYQYELLRFCNILNISVVGGASKLLKYFIKNYHPQSIISYANLRWSNGRLYENLGFTKVGQSNPNYFYFNEDCVLHSRIEFQKHKLKDKLKNFDEKLTESENMYNNGYRKIYDCGNLVYSLTLQ